jgi:hypothetical protein
MPVGANAWPVRRRLPLEPWNVRLGASPEGCHKPPRNA